MAYLTDEDKTFFKENGYLVKHDLLTKSYQARVTACWHPRRSRPVVHRNRSSRHRPSTFGGQENHHFGKIHRCHP